MNPLGYIGERRAGCFCLTDEDNTRRKCKNFAGGPQARENRESDSFKQVIPRGTRGDHAAHARSKKRFTLMDGRGTRSSNLGHPYLFWTTRKGPRGTLRRGTRSSKFQVRQSEGRRTGSSIPQREQEKERVYIDTGNIHRGKVPKRTQRKNKTEDKYLGTVWVFHGGVWTK